METIKESVIQISKNDLKVEGDNLVILYKNKKHSFPFGNISKRLAKASKKERENFVLSPSGYGIHWPEIDEDISIGGLLRPLLKK